MWRSTRLSLWWEFPARGEFLGTGVCGGGVRLVRRSGTLWWIDPRPATVRACVFSRLGGAFRSRVMFLAGGASVPAFMCLFPPYTRGPVGWRLACRSGASTMSPGAPSALVLSRGSSGRAFAGSPVLCSVLGGRASPFTRLFSGRRCACRCAVWAL